MGHLLGAAAGSGMLVLVVMLVCRFFVECGWMKEETLHRAGRVFFTCGLVMAAEYGAMMLMRLAVYGDDGMNLMAAALEAEGGFAGIMGHLPPHGYLTAWYLMMAAAGLFINGAFKNSGDGAGRRALLFAYLLPGAEFGFFPVFGAAPFIAAAACAVYFALRRRKVKIYCLGEAARSGIWAIFAVTKCLILYLIAKGA